MSPCPLATSQLFWAWLTHDNLLQELNAAQRRGMEIETSKKQMAGGNRQHTAAKNTARLDEETEELHHDKVPLCLGKAMQQARQAKEWTQKDLSTVPFLYLKKSEFGNVFFWRSYSEFQKIHKKLGAAIKFCLVTR